MHPKLIAVAGPLKGLDISVLDEMSFGREASNQVYLKSAQVSRRHCTIKKKETLYEVTDLDSYNGTLINGRPVKSQILADGDRITVGDSVFIFRIDGGEGAADSASLIELYEGELINTSTVQLERADSLYLNPESAAGNALPSARLKRDFAILLEISTKINSIRDVASLQQNLLELIFEVIPAESGAILLKDERGEDFSSVIGHHKQPSDAQKLKVSRTIARRVLERGAAILSNDVQHEPPISPAESLLTSQTTSLLCTPLTIYDRQLGVIYLSSSNPSNILDEGHLQIAMAVSSIAAVSLENARHMEELGRENQRLREDLAIEHNMIGESPRMRSVYQTIAKVAPAGTTVLIRGESGTGKELAARAIHENSTRASRPFIAINCAVLTESLLESELFGHERGAFTGAVAQKKGKLELADGGTIFLDEIGEMAPQLQAKLLRVLQEREFERLGGTRLIKLDVRVIAATNRDLERAIADGSFRQDLYYRLKVVSFELPALRERREDIPLLANYFLSKYSERCNRRVRGISSAALGHLTNYDWPGNVRELENVIESAVVMGSTDYILPEDLHQNVLEGSGSKVITNGGTLYDVVTEAKRQHILKAFEEAKGVHNDAAKFLGIHPNNLHRLMKNMNLKKD